MKTFKQYCESRSNQEDAVRRAVNNLCYGKGYTPESIIETPIEQLIADIQQLNLLPTKAWSVPRFAAMIKSIAGDMRQ